MKAPRSLRERWQAALRAFQLGPSTCVWQPTIVRNTVVPAEIRPIPTHCEITGIRLPRRDP